MNFASLQASVLMVIISISLTVNGCARKSGGGAKKKSNTPSTSTTDGTDYSSYRGSQSDIFGTDSSGDSYTTGLGSGLGQTTQPYDPYSIGGIPGGYPYGGGFGTYGGDLYTGGQTYSPGFGSGYNGTGYAGGGYGGNYNPNDQRGSGVDNSDRGQDRSRDGRGTDAPTVDENDRGNGPRVYLQATDKGIFVAFGSNSQDVQTSDRNDNVVIKFEQMITSKETSAALQGKLDISFQRSRDQKTCRTSPNAYTISASRNKYRRTECS